MPGRRRATLLGVWWKNQMALIRRCATCGGGLKSCYVREEGCRRRVCLSCKRITYINPKVVAGLIPVMPDGRVVLLRRGIEPALGRWSYPAGYQELGETVKAAASREAMEEIGIKVSVDSFVGLYSYADAGVVTLVYVGRVRRGQRPRTGTEASEIGLFKPKEIPWNQTAFRSTRDALRDWMKLKRSQKTSP